MRKYSDIVKTVQKNKSNENIIPHGYTLLYYDEKHVSCQYQNFSPQLLKNIDDKYERFRLHRLYLDTIERLVKYRIDELEKDNQVYTIEEVLDYWGYYDDICGETTYDSHEDYNSGDSDYYSD